jgi:enoyl-CoA hydratase/carnithine racemase
MGSRQFVPRPKFEEYKEKYKNFIFMERKDGVILLRMHHDGGPVLWNEAMHNALPQAFHDVGNDLENQVMILTSTDPYWIGSMDPEAQFGFDYDIYYIDATKLLENLIFDVDIPTIAAVNGPGLHTEIALLCDITICTENSVFQDGHFMVGYVAGDGQFLTFQELLGVKRSAYALYTAKKIDAKTALEWGMVNEVVAKEKLVDRAWELAALIMKQSRATRCMTHHLLTRPWKRRLINDFQFHIAQEGFGARCDTPDHDLNRIKETWKK